MSDLTLTTTRLQNKVWEGRIKSASGSAEQPEIKVLFKDQPVGGVTLEASDTPGAWDLKIPVPDYAIAEGVQTFLVVDTKHDTDLGAFSIIAGDIAGDDLRAEVELLRAELDMLKRAFRRHCVETMG
jgi:hypothetical protein